MKNPSETPPRPKGKRRLLWLSLLASASLAIYCLLSAAVSAYFSVACDVSRPQDCAHWRRVAVWYEVIAAIWMIAALTSAIGLFRQRRAERKRLSAL